MTRVTTLVLTLAVLVPAIALENGLALTPPRGFSTWDQWPDEMKPASGHSVTEAQSMKYMQGMVAAGLNKLNYTYFIIDEPCFIGRDASGELIENKTTWPNGLKAFGAELRKNDMKLGIYTCVGPKTCGGCVASEGHEDQDMQTFANWVGRLYSILVTDTITDLFLLLS
jgi:alpha-galactosidase